MTAKVPITVFNNPLISTITATGNSSSDFSFSLSTNFPSGPTFKLSYTPPITATTTTPFSLSLKSGLGLFGSPHNSPLVFSANFSLSSFSTSTPLIPSFSLHFKPQFGHFSLHKTVFSDSNTKTVSDSNPLSVSPQIEKGFVPFPNESSSGWQNLKLEPFGENNKNNDNNVGGGVGVGPDDKNSEKCGLSPCVTVMTKTVLPVTQGLLLNFRWGVNFPGKSGLKVPYLTVNKIGLERVEEEKKDELKNIDNCESDLQMLKEKKMDLENVEKENKELKRVLDEMKMRVSKGKKIQKDQNSGENFQSWGSNKNGRQENEKKQPNKLQNTIVVSDLESELEKAIKAASS
ncbi:hypothetical protein TSUD_231890 [Trifolium subterraneum]|uniref:Uncharacterized protein n=1 Tax=Trifolium subterraneum TaxID=3900 RepID=A0A2Z6NDX1_TRISU|nr:hypothetical protein TSUD_231890 [Trifolium subterraneum]